MLSDAIKKHFAEGSTLARDRIGLGQRMPHGYAIMETSDKKLFWVNEKNESCQPIDSNDGRLIRRLAIQHRDMSIKNGMERRVR